MRKLLYNIGIFLIRRFHPNIVSEREKITASVKGFAMRDMKLGDVITEYDIATQGNSYIYDDPQNG